MIPKPDAEKGLVVGWPSTKPEKAELEKVRVGDPLVSLTRAGVQPAQGEDVKGIGSAVEEGALHVLSLKFGEVRYMYIAPPSDGGSSENVETVSIQAPGIMISGTRRSDSTAFGASESSAAKRCSTPS